MRQATNAADRIGFVAVSLPRQVTQILLAIHTLASARQLDDLLEINTTRLRYPCPRLSPPL